MANFKPKQCKICGATFTPTTSSRQLYCNQPKIKQCANCGKDFEVKCGTEFLTVNCCSKECSNEFTKSQRIKAASRIKAICKWCGKEFTPHTKRDSYCYDTHYAKCVVCGKEFEVDVRTHPETKTCSTECKYKFASSQHDYAKGAETAKQNLMEKYGVDNIVKIPGSIDKMKNTCREKYGTDWYAQTDSYKESVKSTCLEKYGVDHHLKAKEVIDKRKETVEEKYGVSNVFQSSIIKNKSKQAIKEKYGVEYITQSTDIVAKIKQANLKKYGVIHPMMLPEFKQKAERTNIERYGFKAITQQHISNIQEWYLFIDDPKGYIENHYSTRPTPVQLAADLGVDRTTIDAHLEKHNCFNCVKLFQSTMETEIQQFILSIDPTVRIETHDRKIISPLEFDLYLPDYKLAIECNPTATHNSSVADPWGSEPKATNYHKIKTDMSESKDVFLFHIFGYEWVHKKEIICSMLRNLIGKNENVVYARKCCVVDVSGSDARLFLDANHRQGNANSPIRLGLVYNNELVSLMTFGRMRGSIGQSKERLTDCYELVRFCNSQNTSVVGGASKLLKHFIDCYSPARIRSFSDRAHTRGMLYSTLGFNEVARSSAGYVWVNTKDDSAYHRMSAQKQNIRRFLKDDSIDLSKTEKQIMIEHGFVQVFDSGTITWELKVN